MKRSAKSRHVDVLSLYFASAKLVCVCHSCAKSALLSEILNGVIGIVNYIRAYTIRHQQFRQMLQYDDETFSVDLPYHSKVR